MVVESWPVVGQLVPSSERTEHVKRDLEHFASRTANGERRRNSRNRSERDMRTLSGQENNCALVTAITVDGVAILRPSCRADSKRAAPATRFV